MTMPQRNFLNRILFVPAAALAIVVAGIAMQGSSGSAEAQGLDTSTSAAAQSGRAACPSNDIADFFQAFAESPELQRAHTASTVETAFVDWSAQPEPVESAEPMERDKLHFPLLPDRASRQQEGLRYRETAGDENRVTVVLEVPDTDTQLRYTFRRDACWTLIKIVDPAFGRAFPGEAPPVETTRPLDAASRTRK
ncbi:MAG: hypothetical protein J0H31_10455 [Alphaproteobacteria bacterium]|nr:hypothetical protein [Alphaproteobacteria bacterium]